MLDVLDAWFHKANSNGEFKEFGRDVLDAWTAGKLLPRHKIDIARAWRLMRHYLNGVQKRRERGGAYGVLYEAG